VDGEPGLYRCDLLECSGCGIARGAQTLKAAVISEIVIRPRCHDIAVRFSPRFSSAAPLKSSSPRDRVAGPTASPDLAVIMEPAA